ncbi:MAG: sigma-70 family RNA polymerase sigma factor [bacterium]|nr:sigma-70 family RNA polymerase sigma factor [bacterium]
MTIPTNIQAELLKHEAFVRRIASFLLKDPNDVDDVTQELWVRALQRQETDSRSLRMWLTSTMRSMVGNRKRSAGRRAAHERSASVSEGLPCPLDEWTLRQEVVTAVLALDEPFRSTIIWAYGEGLSPSQIAQRQGIPVGTVRSRMHRAHGKLRQVLASDDEGHRSLSALLLAPALPESSPMGFASSQAGVSATVAKSLVVVTAIGACAIGGWFWYSGLNPGVGRPAAQPGSGVAGLNDLTPDMSPVLVPFAAQTDERKPVGQNNFQQVGPADHPFWQAVRAVRDGSPDYVIEESESDAKLRESLSATRVQAHTLPMDLNLAAAFQALQEQSGIPIELSAVAVGHIGRVKLAADWISPIDLSLESALDLLLELTHQNLGWEEYGWDVRQGVVHVGFLGVMHEQGVKHLIDVSDLTLNPADYFASGSIPPALFSLGWDAEKVCVMLQQRSSRLWSGQGTRFEVKEGKILMRGTPRMLLDAQAHLSSIREFFLPLPEKGTPGRSTRIHPRAGDARIIRSLTTGRGIDEWRPEPGKELGTQLKSLGKSRGIGILWTELARQQEEQTADLRYAVLAGCLVVHARGEFGRFTTDSCDLIDMRSLLSGLPVTVKQVKGDPLLTAMFEKGETLNRERDDVVNFLQNRVHPESYDESPEHQLLSFGDQFLFMSHDPWVLDELRDTLEFLAED